MLIIGIVLVNWIKILDEFEKSSVKGSSIKVEFFNHRMHTLVGSAVSCFISLLFF